MARKKAPPAPPRPSRDRVQKAINRGDWTTAYAEARLLQADQPTPEHLALLKSTISTLGASFTDQGKLLDFNRLMEEADRVDPANPEWVVERAILLTRGGRLSDALMRVDEAARPKILGYGADRALKQRSKEFLPDELHAGFDTITAAFTQYESGQDDAARATLETIGLRSPFLEWKLLLRGLLAQATGDDARAAENFSRLDPLRLPSRLAAPYRVHVDAAWKATVPAATLSDLHKQHEKLNASGLVAKLREVAKHIGREKPMNPAFVAAEAAILQWKKHAPHLVQKLANCLYFAIERQGVPEDLARFRKLFGNPADDPSGLRMQARLAEEMGEYDLANLNWRKYDEWLAAKPAGWPEALLSRVRALVWHRMGVNTHAAKEIPDEDEDDDGGFLNFMPPKKKKSKRPKPTGPSPIECFRTATELAPDWENASREYFSELMGAKQFEEAERVTRALLERQPNSLEPLLALADLVMKQQRPDEALALLERARAINPLDDTLRRRVGIGAIARARALLSGKKPAEVEAFCESYREILEGHFSAARDALLATMAKKLGDHERAAALTAKVLGEPGMRLGIALQLAVDAQLAKLKPAEKKEADTNFAAQLKADPRPLEIVNLLIAFDLFEFEGLTYRGQKGHLKKFLALVPRTLTSTVSESEFELLAQMLMDRDELKVLKKFTADCMKKFPRNPAFMLMNCEVRLTTGENIYRLERTLELAKAAAEQAKEPRHRELLPRINELIALIPPPFSFLDSFFDRKF